MAARLRALCHDDVAAGVDRALRVVDLAAHVDDEEPVAMAQVDDLRRYAEPGDERARARRTDGLDHGDQVARARRQEIDAEGLGGRGADGGDLPLHLVVIHDGGTEASEPAGFGDGGGHRGVGHAAHAGEHDRVLDAEQVAERGSNHGSAL